MHGYVELHCHTNYSLLDGASHPEDLLHRAQALGMDSLAVTDHDGLYGMVRFYQVAREKGIKPILGAELTMEGGYHLVLLAKDQTGYSNLCRLISHAQVSHSKGNASLDFEALRKHAEGLFCLSGCRKGEIARLLLAKRKKEAFQVGQRYVRVFGKENFWIELQNHLLPDDHRLIAELIALARHLGVGYVATNNVHYAERSGRQLQDVLVCIKNRTTLDASRGLRYPNSEYYLKSAEEMRELFAVYPEAIANTRAIAEQCHLDLNLAAYRLPEFPVPQVETPFSYLCGLCWEGARRKYGPITNEALRQVQDTAQDAVRRQLHRELRVIEKTGLAGYFLVVWDIVRFAKERGILAQGRGSAANSIVAYVLDITKVDPLRHNLLFERFLSQDAHTMPDIDVDFSARRRDEVIRYVYEKYGEEYTGMVANVVTFRARSAVRDVGKALGFPLPLLDKVAKSLDTRQAVGIGDALAGVEDFADKVGYLPWQQLIALCRQIDGFPRHLSIHVGGMIITGSPLVDLVPLERATMPGRVVIQFNKDDVEDLGLIKIDLLGLRTLSLIEEALELIKAHRGIELDLENNPLDDPAVFDMLCRADTIGAFQVESRAQAQTLPRMRPRQFEDIVVEIALIRPGPIQGNMVHPFLCRRQGLEKVKYLHPKLKPILEETLGVVVFQEQVIRIAMAIAGFSPGEADGLRRAMSRHRSASEMDKLRERFMEGASGNGVDEDIAEEIFRQLAGFASYGFCKSHAAAFAKTAYDTLYLKAHFPTEFYCALLNNQPMGFYRPGVVVGDARRHRVRLLPVHINRSHGRCTLEACAEAALLTRRSDGGIRLGFSYVHGLGQAGIARLEEAQEDGPFRSLGDFCRRTRLSRRAVENLIMVGAMDQWGKPRRKLLWELGKLRYEEEELELVFADACTELGRSDGIELPDLSRAERMGIEYGVLGLPVGDQVMALYRPWLQKMGILSSLDLEVRRDKEKVKVAGLVVVRQAPPTAKGHVFITLEDEWGLVNVIVRPGVYEKFRHSLRNAPLIAVEGVLQRRDGGESVLVERAVALTRP
jgi:error-prone DNA polymerase